MSRKWTSDEFYIDNVERDHIPWQQNQRRPTSMAHRNRSSLQQAMTSQYTSQNQHVPVRGWNTDRRPFRQETPPWRQSSFQEAASAYSNRTSPAQTMTSQSASQNQHTSVSGRSTDLWPFRQEILPSHPPLWRPSIGQDAVSVTQVHRRHEPGGSGYQAQTPGGVERLPRCIRKEMRKAKTQYKREIRIQNRAEKRQRIKEGFKEVDKMASRERGELQKREQDVNQRLTLNLEREAVNKMNNLVAAVRRNRSVQSETQLPVLGVTYGGEGFEDKVKHIQDSAFKFQYLRNLQVNAQTEDGGIHLGHRNLLRDLYLDDQLKESLLQKQRNSHKYKQMLEFRKKLPAFEKQEEILEAVHKNQVIVISGETGCGKTTQVAQLILDNEILAGRGSTCHIVCAQPRRISAMSVSERVASERDEQLGESAGYLTRLENKLPCDKGSILYCTTDIMLQILKSDPTFSFSSHIILDEIHERNIQCDFLITVVRDIIQKRSDLKVILMSATNDKHFAHYFNDVACVHITGITFPVTEHYLEDVLSLTGFMIEGLPCGRTKRGFKQKDNKFVRASNKEFTAVSKPYISQLTGQYPAHVLQSLSYPQSEVVNFPLIVSLLEYIHRNEGEGAILVFLPGWSEIRSVHQLLERSKVFNSANSLILQLHSSMPTVNLKQVFDQPPKGIRKIIIATDIAETNITIDDVVFVVDCGRIMLKTIDTVHNITSVKEEWISCANANHRLRRAGRVQPGICYKLYTRQRQDTFDAFTAPEMLRTQLEEVILLVKNLCLGKVKTFLSRVLDSPLSKVIELSLKLLVNVNALDTDENLTPLGFHLAQLPVDPQTGKMILMGAIFGCLDPVLSVAASLSFEDPFVVPEGQEEAVQRRKRELAGSSKSDHFVLARALTQWEGLPTNGEKSRFARDYFLSDNTLNILREMKGQFAQHLHERKFLLSDDPKDPDANLHSNNLALVKAVLCAGLYPNVARVRKIRVPMRLKDGPPKMKINTPDGGRVTIHPKSINANESEFESPFLAYQLKLNCNGPIYLQDTTMISPLSLIFFGKDVKLEDDEGQTVLVIDQNLKFNCERNVAETFKELRSELDKLLEYKITHPGVTNWSTGTTEGALLNAILNLLTVDDCLTVRHL